MLAVYPSNKIINSTAYCCAIVWVIVLTVWIDNTFLLSDPPITLIKEDKAPKSATSAEVELPQKVALQISQVSLPPPPSLANEKFNKDLPKDVSLEATLDDIPSDDVSQVLTKFTQLDTKQLSLRFPRNQNDTQRILQFMHRCIGIDIGALQGQNLVRLSHKLNQHSPLLRLASGELSQKESALLSAYAKGAPLVRIYPHWFDAGLAKYVAHHQAKIGANALQQLSGEYRLVGQKLWLTQIQLNTTNISKDWLLASSTLCGRPVT